MGNDNRKVKKQDGMKIGNGKWELKIGNDCEKRIEILKWKKRVKNGNIGTTTWNGNEKWK